MNGAQGGGRRIGAALVVVAATVFSLLLPPAGLVALAIAVLCLWPWDGAPARALDTVGLDRRVRLLVGGAAVAIAAVANVAFSGQLDGHLVYRGDFQTYYVGAEVGLRHGWAQVFDQSLQRPLWTAAFADRAPFIPYLNTPPQAWLVAPLTLLPYPTAFAVWVAAMVAVTGVVASLLAAATWPGRAAVATAALALWVMAYSLGSGQNAMFGPLAIVLCWWLLRRGKPAWAGVALALVVMRPNATFLVPFAVLLAGQRRAFIVWLLASTAVGAVILVSLGPNGVRQFLELGAEIRRTHPGAVTLTVAHILGDGIPGLLVGVALAGAALAVAFRAGSANPGLAIAAGVLASMFVTPYVHIQDYLSVLAAAAIVARTSPRGSLALVVAALLVAAPPGTLFGETWPVVVLAVEVLWLGWMVAEVLPRRGIRRRQSGPAVAPGSAPRGETTREAW